MGRAPFIKSTRERESPLDEYRLAKGWTIKELSDRSGVSPSLIYNYTMGVISPIHLHNNDKVYAGQIKESALALCEALNVEVSDLFPRYVCRLKTEYEAYSDDQIIDISISEYSRVEANFIPSLSGEDLQTLNDILSKAMSNLFPRQEKILRERFFEDKSGDELSEKMHVSKSRIFQIIQKALEKLRLYCIQELKELYY